MPLKWSDMVDPYAPENETPVGYDFTLDTVATLGYNQARIGRDTKQLPEYREMFPTDYNGTEMWYLKPGPYFVKFLEKVMIPGDMMAYMRPRSTLLRCGIALETAVWDAGYEGKSGALLIVHNPNGVLIERFTRIGHMVMHPLSTPNGLYVGQYQKEGVN